MTTGHRLFLSEIPMFRHCALSSYALTHNPPTNIVGFRGLDSSIILIYRGGILMSMGNSQPAPGLPLELWTYTLLYSTLLYSTLLYSTLLYSTPGNVSRDYVSREIGCMPLLVLF